MYAPAPARRRHLEAAEQLVAEIDPGQIYPQEFVIFRITGYRPDRAGPPVSLVGAALVADLVTLIQRLSRSLDLASDGDDRTAITLEEAARRLNVSAKTLQRYRQQGLVCHYVVFPDGVKRLVCFEDSLERFESGHPGWVARAAAFSRVDAAVQESIIQEARELSRSSVLSLNAAARRLAHRFGRAHETVRSILQRHERRAAEPIFTERGPLRERDVRLIHRADRWGVSSTVLARRFGKTRPTIHRAVNRRRAELLCGLDLEFVALPAMDHQDADSAILSVPAVTAGLDRRLPRDDALALIEAALRAQPPDPDIEQALVGGYNLLKRRARNAIAALPEHPASNGLDEIETDLRWATLLKRRLVETGLPAAVGAVEQALHRPLVAQPSEEILTLIRLAVEVVAGSVETHNPVRGRRMARSCGFAMSKALAVRWKRPSTGRAGTRHPPGAVRMPDPFDSLNPWQPWLQLRPDLERFVAALQPPLGRLVALRYGLEGMRPLTVAELAEDSRGTASTVARLLAGAEAQLRRMRREGTKGLRD
jgi:AraC-like DNA-binding protein